MKKERSTLSQELRHFEFMRYESTVAGGRWIVTSPITRYSFSCSFLGATQDFTPFFAWEVLNNVCKPILIYVYPLIPYYRCFVHIKILFYSGVDRNTDIRFTLFRCTFFLCFSLVVINIPPLQLAYSSEYFELAIICDGHEPVTFTL
jgi:hypothetical protein